MHLSLKYCNNAFSMINACRVRTQVFGVVRTCRTEFTLGVSSKVILTLHDPTIIVEVRQIRSTPNTHVLTLHDHTIHISFDSEWFGQVWQVQTTPNSQLLTLPSPFSLDLSGSWRFGRCVGSLRNPIRNFPYTSIGLRFGGTEPPPPPNPSENIHWSLITMSSHTILHAASGHQWFVVPMAHSPGIRDASEHQWFVEVREGHSEEETQETTYYGLLPPASRNTHA